MLPKLAVAWGQAVGCSCLGWLRLWVIVMGQAGWAGLSVAFFTLSGWSEWLPGLREVLSLHPTSQLFSRGLGTGTSNCHEVEEVQLMV